MVLIGRHPNARLRSSQLLEVLRDYQRVTVVMHDNPDPDAIATGWAVLTMVQERLQLPTVLVGGGAIVRAENRHLVDLLSPPIQLADSIAHRDDNAVVLVDCSFGGSNHLVTRQSIHPVAVIDHHQSGKRETGVPFIDLRSDVAASTTIAASYLMEQGIEPGEKLATCMLYAIRTETCGFETDYSELDRTVVVWLTERADPSLLAAIQSAPLSRDYFSDLALALQNTVVYGDAAFCLLPRAEGAEIVGELADLLIRCRGVNRVFSGAMVENDLLVSLRTKDVADNASSLVTQVLDGIGSGGGHSHRAGGKVPRAGTDGVLSCRIKTELRRRWRQVCQVDQADAAPLISRHEIIENL